MYNLTVSELFPFDDSNWEYETMHGGNFIDCGYISTFSQRKSTSSSTPLSHRACGRILISSKVSFPWLAISSDLRWDEAAPDSERQVLVDRLFPK